MLWLVTLKYPKLPSHWMNETIKQKYKDIICKTVQDTDRSRDILVFSRSKTIKRIMELERDLFMPKHIPKGTPEDPDYPEEMGYREFTQEEKDNCACSNCKYPYEYWEAKEDVELKRDLASLEHLLANPV